MHLQYDRIYDWCFETILLVTHFTPNSTLETKEIVFSHPPSFRIPLRSPMNTSNHLFHHLFPVKKKSQLFVEFAPNSLHEYLVTERSVRSLYCRLLLRSHPWNARRICQKGEDHPSSCDRKMKFFDSGVVGVS